ncbi:MAG TPA: hypothetical protein VNA11_21060 [Pseudonocardia sp.]|nr:hypothetical protein [Pseudonocardia sp.]
MAADLAVFVDRLAAAGSDRPTAAARVQIQRAIGEGSIPPGVRRLAEALAASVDRAPAPRRPAEAEDSVAAAMRSNNLVVLDDVDPGNLAETVDLLLADGKRVLVTGPDQQLAMRIRHELPARTAGRVLDRLPGLANGEMRELRSLLATSTPGRRARSGQELPTPADLPDPAQVAELCRQSTHAPDAGRGASLVPGLLAGLDPDRRGAVTAVAHLVNRSLTALPSVGECGWAWRLLSDLVLAQHRPVFEGLLEDSAQAMAAVDRGRDAAPVTFTVRPADNVLGVLRHYRDFLSSGGRCRTYFRTSVQREAQPVLAGIRVAGRVPTTLNEVIRVVDYLELGEWLRRVCTGCGELGLPSPRDDGELCRLHDVLLRVAAAVRSVSALRHDVLFLAEDSPLSVPDVDTAADVAVAVLDYELNGSAVDARRQLDSMADRLAACSPVLAVAPEHEQACTALRERDAEGYLAAVEALVAARREQRDETRRTTLLQRLGAVAPGLASAWAALAAHSPAALGMAVFRPMEELLAELPPPDSVDVLLVLGAAALGVEHLLLTAAAPRLIAAVGPGERPGPAPTLLSVLQRADALVIHGKAGGPTAPVVPISVVQQQSRIPRQAALGQAGA